MAAGLSHYGDAGAVFLMGSLDVRQGLRQGGGKYRPQRSAATRAFPWRRHPRSPFPWTFSARSSTSACPAPSRPTRPGAPPPDRRSPFAPAKPSRAVRKLRYFFQRFWQSPPPSAGETAGNRRKTVRLSAASLPPPLRGWGKIVPLHILRQPPRRFAPSPHSKGGVRAASFFSGALFRLFPFGSGVARWAV